MAMDLCVELTYFEMLDDGKLDAIAAQGVKTISAPFEFVESAPKQILKERAAALAERGIKTATSHPRFGYYNSDNSFVNQYVVPRTLYLEQLKDAFERMSILGAANAPLHTNGACLAGAPAWAMELLAESINAVIPAAADAGIVLAVENTFFHMPQRWDGGTGTQGRPAQASVMEYDDIGKLCSLIDQLNSPYVKGCFDAGHAHYLGDLRKDHELMGDGIILYHLHDNSRDRDMHLPPGYGTLDWETCGALMAENKTEYTAYIEAGPWMLGTYGLMMRETAALLAGGRNGESRRCLKCGHLILSDAGGKFCGCA